MEHKSKFTNYYEKYVQERERSLILRKMINHERKKLQRHKLAVKVHHLQQRIDQFKYVIGIVPEKRMVKCLIQYVECKCRYQKIVRRYQMASLRDR